MIILKVTKNQGFILSLEEAFFEKPLGRPPPSHFRINTIYKNLHLSINEEFLAIYSLFFYCVRNQVKQYAAVATYLKSAMYISISSRLL